MTTVASVSYSLVPALVAVADSPKTFMCKPEQQWHWRSRLLQAMLFTCIAWISDQAYSQQQVNSDNTAPAPCCEPSPTDDRTTRRHDPSPRGSASGRTAHDVRLPLNINAAFDMSLENLLGDAKSTLEKFNALRLHTDLFLGLDADIDDRVVHHFGLLVYKLSKLIDALRDAGENTGTGRLSELPANTRRDATRLFLAVQTLQQLMEAKDRCGLRNLGIFLSAVETLALELKTDTGAMTGHAQGLDYFFFAGQLPTVVPQDGGWLYMAGPGIRHGDRFQVILSEPVSGKTIAKLDAQRDSSGEVVAIRIVPDLITDNMGRCLSLQVNNMGASGILLQKPAEPQVTGTQPFCIPQSYGSQFRIAGFLEYSTPTHPESLKSRSILFENDSCVERKQVSASAEWTLPPGSSLTDLGESSLYEAGSSSIQCAGSENRIQCTGYLDKAICAQALHSPESGEQPALLLLEMTEWEHIFTPTAIVPIEKDYRSHVLSETVDFSSTQQEIAVLVPREVSSETTTVWYELIIVNGRQQKKIFASSRKEFADRQQDTYPVGHDSVTASIDPETESAVAVIRVSVDPAKCPY